MIRTMIKNYHHTNYFEVNDSYSHIDKYSLSDNHNVIIINNHNDK